MQMVPVTSSNLVSVGYEPLTQTLRIKFHNGLYDYFGVPSSIHQGLLSASSKGQYHHQYIKNNYSYNRVD